MSGLVLFHVEHVGLPTMLRVRLVREYVCPVCGGLVMAESVRKRAKANLKRLRESAKDVTKAESLKRRKGSTAKKSRLPLKGTDRPTSTRLDRLGQAEALHRQGHVKKR